MTEGYLKNKYEKELKIMGCMIGFNLNSNYMFHLKKIISNSIKILKKYKEVKENDVINLLNECINEINGCINRIKTLHSPQAKCEMRTVVEFVISNYSDKTEQMLNEK